MTPAPSTITRIARRPSLDLDLGVVDDFLVFRHLVVNVGRELFTARPDRIESERVQALLHVRQRQQFGDVRLQLVGKNGWQVLRSHNPYQDTNAKPFTPDSSTVGMSGAAAARLRLVRPSALILPPCASGSEESIGSASS